MPQLLLRRSSTHLSQATLSMVKRLDQRIQAHVEPLRVQFERYLAPARVAGILAGTLGLLALALASIGMLGVFAYLVRQRSQEIGVRMVLGASSRSVLIGLDAGLLISIAVSRILHRFLYGLTGLDPIAYRGVGDTVHRRAGSYLAPGAARKPDSTTPGFTLRISHRASQAG